jgi:cell division protein FtsI/penicillin-binding protein 2
MYSSRDNRGEKLSTLKLTVVQYGILFMMLALAAGLWRLQVLGADNFRVLAEQNRIRKVPVLARAASSSTAKTGWWWTTTPRSPASWCANRTATWTPICR